MKTIAETDFYAIEVDASKNRAYLTIRGFWSSHDNVPNYLDDWRAATACLSKGFTVVTNVTDMMPPSHQIDEVHVQAQQMLIKAGLDRVAEYAAGAFTRTAIDSYSARSGMQKQVFATCTKRVAPRRPLLSPSPDSAIK